MESEAANRVLKALLKLHNDTGKRRWDLTVEELQELTNQTLEDLSKGLRRLENNGEVSIWRRSKYPGCFNIGLKIKAFEDQPSPAGGGVQNSPIQASSSQKQQLVFDDRTSVQLHIRPNVHFLEAVAKVKDTFVHREMSFQVDAAEVELLFGQYNRKIDLRVSMNKPGLDRKQLQAVLKQAFGLINQHVGRAVDYSEFKIANLHLSVDFLNMRLEGVKAVTLSDLDGWLARLYNKEDSLRSESVYTGGNITLDQAWALMSESFIDRTIWRDSHKALQRLLKDLDQREAEQLKREVCGGYTPGAP